MTQPSQREMLLVAFMQASNCSNYTGSWRHPETAQNFLDLRYYQDIARILESGKFHMAFIDDRLAMPSRYGDSFAEAVEHGVRAVKLDLVPVITAMGLATSHLGLGATYSTTYYSPFHVARLFGSLDHFTNGRAAWNVVTSLNDSEAHNFGVSEHLEHDDRYEMADEFMEAASALWDSWDDGAVMADRDEERFGDSTRVRRSDYSGQHLSSRGPLTVPRSPQGHPVIIQAGQSQRGRRFAARWGEMLFVIFPTPEGCRAYRDDLRNRAESLGRDPDSIKVAPAVYAVVGETEQEAAEKLAFIDGLARPVDSLALLSEVFNYDFAQHRPDEPLSDETMASMTGLRGFLDRVIQLSGNSNPSLNDSSAGPAAAPSASFPPSTALRHRSPTRCRRGSTQGPATGSCSPPPTCPAPTTTSCAWWCRNCSAGASSAANIRRAPSATTWAWPGRCGGRWAGT